LENQPELAATGADQPGLALIGRALPRLESARFGDLSHGHAVAAWAQKYMSVTLMDWQKHALFGQLECDDTGKLLRSQSLVETARQQGKTVALSALIGWWLTEFAQLRGTPQNVLSTAHKLDRAEAIFLYLQPILTEYFNGKPMRALGRKSVDMPDGSRWEVRAATPGNAHGGSNDLIVCDELWNIQPTVVFDALQPSQIARPNPLFSCWSTAGDESSTAMLRMREQGINDIDAGLSRQLYFASWSPPPGVDVNDQQWWAWSNPALGVTVSLDALIAASQKPDRTSWLRAHLNLWVAAAQGWLPNGKWAECQTDTISPTGGTLAIDSSLDDSRYVGVRSVANPDGTVTCTVEFAVESEQAMWAEVVRVLTDPTVQLAITPMLDLHLPDVYRRRAQTVGYGELLKFTPLVRNMIIENRLYHTGENALAEHCVRAVMVKTQAGSALSSAKSPGPIELARCMIFASALASKPINKNKPLLVVVNG
jgi:phage terminase large subunit-like protein